jgi:hypothetical protein
MSAAHEVRNSLTEVMVKQIELEPIGHHKSSSHVTESLDENLILSVNANSASSIAESEGSVAASTEPPTSTNKMI